MASTTVGGARCLRLGLLLTACLSASAASAQGQAGSEGSVLVAAGLSSAGGEASSAGFTLRSGLAQPLATESLASTGLETAGGVLAVPADVPNDAPLVFGVREGLGEATGGEAVSVFGFGFTAAGAGPNDVDFGGSPATGVAVVSNTELSATTPAGVDANGNPLAFTAVEVTNALGSHTAEGGYLYRPALTLTDLAAVGGEIRLRLYSAPGSFGAVLNGGSVPGLTVPIPPYAGSLELLTNLGFVTGLLPLPTGQFVLSNPIAPNPLLAGVVVELQVLSFDDATLSSGSWTNRLPITFQL